MNEDHDYRILDLKRTIADDALTIHTCEEIIERTKKELGDYRELYFDMKKERAHHIDAMSTVLDNWKRDVEKIEAERDAALAEVAKLKEQINDIYRRL